MNPVNNPVAGVDRAFLYIIAFSLFFLFSVTLMMIVFVIRYRRSRHPEAADIRGHTGLEIAWMTIPTAIALSMFYIGWKAYLGLRTVPKGALEINVTGEMYAWTFAYTNGKETASELVVPLNRPVKINLASRDVIHSFSVPSFRIKMDAVKGLETYVWFMPNRLGTFNIFCTEYCGVGHSDMNANLRIVPEAEFNEWLARPEAPASAAGGPASEELQKLFDLSQFHHLQDKMSFFWRVDGPLLHVKLRSPGLGWVAIGFNPTRGMQGANFVLAYVKNGKAFADDHYGTSPIQHEPDEKLGGRSDVLNVFGTETNGSTEVGFSIPLQSGDSRDSVLATNADTTVLLAYSTGMDNFRSKHNWRRAFKVNLDTGAFKPVEASAGSGARPGAKTK